MRYCYIAQPIDEARHSVDLQTSQLFRSQMIPSFDPRLAWEMNGIPPGAVVQEINRTALRQASAMLVMWPSGSASIGVPMEMELARSLGIPVVVCSNRDRERSAALSEFPAYAWHTDLLGAVRSVCKAMGETSTSQDARVARWCGDGSPPLAHKEGDAGYDLVVSQRVVVLPGEQASIPSEIAIQLPDGYWALIQGRSSSWKRGLSVKASVIDAGYRGELWADVHNLTHTEIEVLPGERIAQLIPFPLPPTLQWQQMPLDPSERGASGYGSTGR